MAFNLVCIPIIYFFFPETKRVQLEDMEALFNHKGGESMSSLPDPVSDEGKHATPSFREI
jgi:hypothetical protein